MKTKQTIAQWLTAQMTETGTSPTSLAKLVDGLNQPTVKRVADGETKSPGLNLVRKITEAIEIARKQAGLLPLSSTELPNISAQSIANVIDAPEIKGRIPLISWVQAGMWNETVDIYEPGYAERWLPFMKNNGEQTFALRVVGDSMTSRFGKSYPEGCIIFVDPSQRTPSNGDRIIAKLNDSEEVTFKVFSQDAGKTWLRPLNEMYPPIYDEFYVVGKVIGKWEDE